jgi:hypothetical protein
MPAPRGFGFDPHAGENSLVIPFDPPRRGKIAVRVINHYGDEILRVYTVRPTRNGK